MSIIPVLELYFYETCPYCQRVLRVIEDLGVKVIYRNIRKSEEFRNKLIEDTDRATVPCLYIDGVPMHESRDIIFWLQENAHRLEKMS